MSYRLINGSTLIERLSDGALIPADPRNRAYQEFIAWQQAGNTPQPAPAAAPEPPDYVGFWDAVLLSQAYQSLLAQAMVALPVNTALTAFIAAFQDAKVGRPNVPAIQACIGLVVGAATLTAAHREELEGLMTASRLSPPLVLPPAP
ncbi:hypothetical protein [Cyanobium sp. N5-Cardenillas]|uniref:hypothetical protein n=1 Tax=Cyanobium sp. N5-Cardenillas TaxID=2823720 RepID=UPI0020CDD847|nr:hypothetical protein [Cyanobium sp. N5-Cardenillas]MCP9785401.1 hypothetical protein [Cyanobium sp. N5-Cardenillas]